MISKKIWARSLKEGALQFWRHRFLSFTTLLLGALIIFLLNLIFALEFWADFSLKRLETRADFSVPLVSEKVSNYSFMLNTLKSELENNFTIELDIIPGNNFLPTRLHIKFGKLEEVSEVLATLKKPTHVDIIDSWDMTGEDEFVHLTEKMLTLRSSLDWMSLSLLLLFLGGGILLILNTFRLLLFARKDEIAIARLVGAKSGFILLPFVIEGAILGIMASLVAVLSTVGILIPLGSEWGGLLFLHFWNHIFSWEIFISMGIAAIGAWIAVRRYVWGKFSLFD